MKRILILIVLLIGFLFRYTVTAHEDVYISAQNVVLMESQTGRVLYAKQENNQRSVASISKIMTALLAIENAYLDEVVTISEKASLQHGSSIYTQKGQQFYMEDLVYALLLRSGNDVAFAIAEHVGGNVDDFVYMMNEKAKELKMVNTVFGNPSGLDDSGTENISTAYDMALLTQYAMENPYFREIFGATRHRTKSLCGQYYLWNNKHRLVRNYDYVIGGKTGFTKHARRTLVTVASRDQLELIVVTLNAGDDWNDHLQLFEYGFNKYEMQTLIRKGIFEVKGLHDIFYIDDKIEYPMARNEYRDFRFVVDYKSEDEVYLLLVKDKEVILKREIEVYDKTHQSAESISILGLGKLLLEFIKELLW